MKKLPSGIDWPVGNEKVVDRKCQLHKLPFLVGGIGGTSSRKVFVTIQTKPNVTAIETGVEKNYAVAVKWFRWKDVLCGCISFFSRQPPIHYHTHSSRLIHEP